VPSTWRHINHQCLSVEGAGCLLIVCGTMTPCVPYFAARPSSCVNGVRIHNLAFSTLASRLARLLADRVCRGIYGAGE
jgi:hypothetical protein